MLVKRFVEGALLASLLVGCSRQQAVSTPVADGTPASALQLERSPGGTLELSPEQLSRLLASGGQPPIRVVDVREQDELNDELGHIAGVEWVPLGQLAEASQGWDPAQPIVLVCRSGRRSARGAEQLEALGFRNPGSMTGGMLRWHELGLPTSRSAADVRRDPAAGPASAAPRPGAGTPVYLDPRHVRWVRTAALLATGSESCVDGRDSHAVIGTPGGDAGELLLALAAAEQAGSKPLAAREVETVIDAWLDAFGRLYIHSDVHALQALRARLLADPRFARSAPQLADVTSIEALVRHPPRELAPLLLEHLLAPESVGCGHLRSMLLAPDSYQVRKELVVSVLQGIFQRLWRAPESIDWVVLSGEHDEQAVVVVRLAGEIRPYTKVPAIAPASELGQAFVAHPQVTAYLREQNASFLLEQLPALRQRVSLAELGATFRSLADTQLAATLERLAAGLPRYEARFLGRGENEVSLVRLAAAVESPR